MGHTIKLLLLGTLFMGGEVFASASAGEKCDVINEDAKEKPASVNPSPFQVELAAVQAAKAAFIGNPTPDFLRVCVAPVVDLFSAMHKVNEIHGKGFDEAVIERTLGEAQTHQGQYMALSQPSLNAEVTRHYLPGVIPSAQTEEDALRGRVCGAYLGMVNGLPSAFALHNLAQQHLYAFISTLSRKHRDVIANEAWTTLKVEASSLGVDQTFVVNFLSLPKALQDLLFVNHGDKTHESWQPRMARISVSAAIDPAWTAITGMDKEALTKNLTPLIEKHQNIRDEIAARESVSRATRGFEAYDHFNTCYNQVSSFFWAAEKALLDAIMLDRRDAEYRKRLRALLEAWSDTDKSPYERIPEFVTDIMDAIMLDRSDEASEYKKCFRALLKILADEEKNPDERIQECVAALDPIMLDLRGEEIENKNRFMPLLEAWSDTDKNPEERVRELITGTLDAIMLKRFALTSMLYCADQSPSALAQNPPSPAPAPATAPVRARPEDEVDVDACEEDQDA